MSAYTRQYETAIRLIRAKGAPITFTSTPVTQNTATRSVTNGTPVTITGSAIRVQGDPTQYEALGLVLRSPVTLLFAADAFGDAIDMANVTTAPWNGVTLIVKDVSPVAPDGPSIVSRVVLAS